MKRHSLYLLSLSLSVSICTVSSFVNAQQQRLVDTCIPPTTVAIQTNSDTETSTMKPLWFQHEITVTAPKRGCHLITADIQKAAGESIRQCQIGLCNIFVQHTSASLTINENADPDVRTDMETALNKIVPAQWNRDGTFRHTMEGDDDMPGHVKSSLMGVSLTIPIRQGRLALGTWQGIYLNEHRDQGGWGGGHARNIIITIQGQGK
jgi:secondary thiamine-phosphate synthase enzyme